MSATPWIVGRNRAGAITARMQGILAPEALADLRAMGCVAWAVADHYPAPDEADALDWTDFETEERRGHGRT